MAVINAEGLVLGRLASLVAKRLLEGEEIVIVNAEKAVVTGNKEEILERYRQKRERGHRYKGPFFPGMPHLIVKRTVRGMLPWKKERGREALKRLKVHIGVPEELKNAKFESPEEAKVSRKGSGAWKFVTLGEISRFLGWKGEE